jgi:uncharacterized protein (TIGR00106 family)
MGTDPAPRPEAGEESPVLAAFSVSPLGGSDSVGDVVAGVVRIVRESGLPNETSAMFTTVEGSPAEVFDLLRRCIEYAEQHAPRVSIVAKFDHRPGHEGALRGKVERVETALTEGTDPR